ncbi:MAG TPA: carboxypeptidase-like regulatory domain-containing protein, partial [Blastocatellia bacterium]|nr:carboxypeptidase-like regulatory domain-containing protein [Blastocatellia bacterium]
MRNSLTRISRVALTILLLTVLSVAASAQFKAGIQGTVTDATGAVVSGAKITVINKETSRELTATSNETGFYRVTGLPPGNYKVLAERDGFKRRELENVIVGAETAQGLELILEAGQISETVT